MSTPVELQVAFVEQPVSLAELATLAAAAAKALALAPPNDCGLLVSPVSVQFGVLPDFRTAPLPAGLERGIFFGAGGQIEIREVAAGRYRIVAFREGAPLPLDGWLSESVKLLKDCGDPDSLVLWGKKSPGSAQWHEGRVRYVQHYPWPAGLEAPEHAALQVTVYREPASMQPAYVWWRGLTKARTEELQ